MGCYDIIQVIIHKPRICCYFFNLSSVTFVLLHLILVCSNEDFEVMDQIFLTTQGANLESFLENDYHYRLHIHTRDFELGRTIDSNIEEAITHSRRLIVLLSR